LLTFGGGEDMRERLSGTAEALRHAVEAAGDHCVEAVARDGWLRVVANGTPRLVEAEIDPRLMRCSAAELSPLLVGVVDEALRTARQRYQEAVTAALPPGLLAAAQQLDIPSASNRAGHPGLPGSLDRVLTQLPDRLAQTSARARELAEESINGTAADGELVVTMFGDGRVREIHLGRGVLSPPDSAALAGHLVTATNDALTQVAERLARYATPDDAPDIDAALKAFNARMDDLIVRLDAVSRALDT
jgi:DNA-binding protein YbaB